MAGQKETSSGKRGTKIVTDFARDDSSLDVPTCHGKDLNDRGISHSVGTSVASSSVGK